MEEKKNRPTQNSMFSYKHHMKGPYYVLLGNWHLTLMFSAAHYWAEAFPTPPARCPPPTRAKLQRGHQFLRRNSSQKVCYGQRRRPGARSQLGPAALPAAHLLRGRKDSRHVARGVLGGGIVLFGLGWFCYALSCFILFDFALYYLFYL